MNTILCPTDFSKNAEKAAEFACAIGELFNSNIVLLNVYETPVVFSEMEFTAMGNIEEAIKEKAGKNAESLIRKLNRVYKNVQIKAKIVKGSASNEILSRADKLKADLIVMGTTGMSKIQRLLMGSTTSAVIEKSNCPVLCIPKNAKPRKIQKIIFATDLHEDNIGVAAGLMPFAAKMDAEIVFVFVDDKHLIHSDSEVNRMTKKIKSRIKYPKISGYISKNTSITKGLEYFLKKYPADMLAMYTHKKHFPQSLFNQSMTKIMSHQTNIPLLVLNVSDKPVL